jgi:hypothetical protein
MSTKFWVGVASKEHVENGVKLGICQFCHGKIGPAKRLQKGDFVIYYSSKVLMEGNELTPTVVKDSILAIGVTKVYHHGFDN